MKNLAKVLALVLAMTMVMSTMVFAANPFKDVDDAATYAEAVTMLSDLKILAGYEEEDGTYFKPDQTITRAEVAKVIVCALGAEDAAAGASNLNTFSDVDATHWAAGYVNYIAGYNNIIAGYGDGTFGPSDPVLYEQVIKMIVCALGYYPMAMQRGGYPTGFLAVASELGLTKGATGSAGEPAKRWVVARALYNALTVPMMKQTGWDINAPEYTITGTDDYEEETLLCDYLDVVKVNGIVTETFYQLPVDKENLTVTIEGMNAEDAYAVNGDEDETSLTIEIGNTEAEQYLGYAVTAYVFTDEDTEEKVLVAIAPRGTRNTVKTFSLSDMQKESTPDKKKPFVTLTFEDAKGDETDVKVSEDATIFVNFVEEGDLEVTEISGEYFEKDGTITFIQNETSDKYADYVIIEHFVEDPAPFVITKLNADKAKIEYDNFESNGKSITLDAEDEESWVFFFKNGEEITFDDLAVGDVISIVSNDSTITKAYVTSDTIEGKISNVNTGKETITVAGTKYDYKYYDFDGKLGSTGIFYMNVNGDVIFFDETEGSTSNDDFAYLYSVAYEEDKWGSNPVVTMRVLDADGTWNEYDFANKVTIKNGEVENKNLEVEKYIEDAFEGDDYAGYTGVFQYKLNTSGKVSTIILPSNELSEDYLSSAALGEDAEFVEEDYTIDGLELTDDVVVFAIADGDASDEENISVSSVSSVFEDGEDYTGWYFISEDGDVEVPNALAINTKGSAVKESTRFFVVYEVSEYENEEGDPQDAISGYTNGGKEMVTLFVEEDAEFEYEGLLEGDVVALTTNENNEVCDLKVLVTADEVLAYKLAEKNEEVAVEIDDEKVQVMAGFVKAAETNKAGVKYFDLSEVIFDDNTDAEDVESIARVREPNLKGNVYYVDLSGKEVSIDVAADFADVAAANISLEKDGKTAKGGEGYFMYAKSVDKDIIDVVVFIVDCADYFEAE